MKYGLTLAAALLMSVSPLLAQDEPQPTPEELRIQELEQRLIEMEQRLEEQEQRMQELQNAQEVQVLELEQGELLFELREREMEQLLEEREAALAIIDDESLIIVENQLFLAEQELLLASELLDAEQLTIIMNEDLIAELAEEQALLQLEFMETMTEGCAVAEGIDNMRDYNYTLVRELARDGYIDPNDEHIKVEIKNKKIKVNGESMKEEHLKKYLKLHEQYHPGERGHWEFVIDLGDC